MFLILLYCVHYFVAQQSCRNVCTMTPALTYPSTCMLKYCVVMFSCSVHVTDVLNAGSPFSFVVASPDKVCASGYGLDLVRTGKAATFMISAPGAKQSDFSVKITGTIFCTCFLSFCYRRISLVLHLLKIKPTPHGRHDSLSRQPIKRRNVFV